MSSTPELIGGAPPATPWPRRALDLWWLHPVRLVLLVVLPLYLGTMAFDMRRVVANVYIPGLDYGFGVLLILALAVGAHAAQPRTPGALPDTPALPVISRGVMMALLLPMLGAYALWFGPLVARPDLLAEIPLGNRAELRDSLSTVAGITTFTQFGVAYVIAYALKRSAGVQPISRLERIGLVLVFVLAALRAFAWAERLAVLELAVCFTVARMAFVRIDGPGGWRLATLLPAVAPLVLYGLFTASEYFRSWEYYTNQYDSVWAFTLDRLLAYYATAVNNGVGALVDTHGWPHYSGAFLVESVFRMPGLGPWVTRVLDDPRHVPEDWLQTFARPEFNSPTDFFRVVLDIGYLGALVWFVVLGFVIGRAYLGMRSGRPFGLLMYGVFVLYLLESIRYGYLGESRFVPAALGLLLVAVDMRRQRAQALSAAWRSVRRASAGP